MNRTRREVTRMRLEVTGISWFPAEVSQGWEQESGRVGEISVLFCTFVALNLWQTLRHKKA